ncbi:MAG: phage tail protein [Solobacterium sp.]|nr:phage tail protein [Solobacterium sp.]
MKPILFAEGSTDFSTNGIGRLSDAISCKVTEERNGGYELHMEYPIDGQLMGDIRYSRIIVAKPADNKSAQPFRIYRISKPLSGVVEIDAEHISYQMAHIPIMPFNVVGLTNAMTAVGTYAAETNPFTFSREGAFGQVIGNSFKVEAPDNLRSLLFGKAGSFIDVYGGEWEFDGFNAILHKDRGADNGVTIRYGKNLTDLKQEENIESTYTGICPYWKGQENGSDVVVSLPEKVLHTNQAQNYPYQRTKIVDMTSSFQTKPTVEQLRQKGQEYIQNNDVGSPTVSLDVSFVALHQTQEYADLTRIEHINLCDTVKVVFPALNVSTKAKVVKTVWNVLLDRYDSITIGAVQGRLSATLQASQEKAVEQAVAQSAQAASTEYASKAELQSVAHATARIDTRMYEVEDFIDAMSGTNGGYIFLTIDDNEQTDELIVTVDSPVFATAQKMFRFNESGLCYTTGGYEHGTWTTIIDNTGKVNTSALSGIISDAASKNSWNLTTGAMALASDVTFGGKSIATIVGELMPDVSGSLRTALNTYDTNLNQTAVLNKLKAGTDPSNNTARTDNGFYLGSDGYLHMLPERVITGGANISSVYLPTTIVNGEVTSSVQVQIVNGIIYPASSS